MTEVMINPLESHAATTLSVTPLGPCCRCGVDARLRCHCGVLLCDDCRPKHMGAVGAVPDQDGKVFRRERPLWMDVLCTKCGKSVFDDPDAIYGASISLEGCLCPKCSSQGPLPKPRPNDDVIIRGGCGHRDVTMGDLGEQLTFVDVLVWLGIAAAIVGAVLLWTALY